MTRKIKIVSHREELLKTVGMEIDYFTKNLGYWKKRTEEGRLEKFKQWRDTNKYDVSLAFCDNKKIHKVFQKGYTISDQTDRAIVSLAGSGNEDVNISIYELMKSEELKFKALCETERDIHRTIFHNISGKHIPNEDSNRVSQIRADDLDDNTPDVDLSKLNLNLPSFKNNIYKAGFDPDQARRE